MSNRRNGALMTLILLLGAGAAHGSTIPIGDLVITTTLVGDAIEVDVANVAGGDDFGLFGDSGGNRAFAFNVVDPVSTVAISNLTSGFSYAGAGVTDIGGGLGDFDFVINGPHSGADATLPLHFTVTRNEGFTSDASLYEVNALGNLFGAHVQDVDGGPGGFIAASALDETEHSASDLAPVPEPASLLLVGTGLAIAARRFRQRH
jgi:hypothetical protein